MPITPEIQYRIFEQLKSCLEACCPPMVQVKNTADSYEIMGNKPVPYGSDKKIIPGMYFASIVARKDMVSFYFFPMYTHGAEFSKLAPTAYKCLRGKTCFNFKKPEQVIEKEIIALLKKGMQVWKREGYMK
jgi:hypothetical protein